VSQITSNERSVLIGGVDGSPQEMMLIEPKTTKSANKIEFFIYLIFI
jgi:hypothetical protein